VGREAFYASVRIARKQESNAQQKTTKKKARTRSKSQK
jgi:hypothetical protein